jgi:putative heme-binding domain-containing protein
VGARRQDREIAEVLRLAQNHPSAESSARRVSSIQGLTVGLRQQADSHPRLPETQRALVEILNGNVLAVNQAALSAAKAIQLQPSAELSRLLHRAAATVGDEQAAQAQRELSLGILGLDPSCGTIPTITKFLDPKQPEGLQLAAATALAAIQNPQIGTIFIGHWREATSKVRDRMLAWYFSDRSRLPELLKAVKEGTAPAWSLGPAHTQQLLQSQDPAIRSLAQSLLGEAAQSDRKAVYNRYLPALKMKGDPQKGRQVYERTCSECHKLGTTGSEVGPDLRTVTTHYKEALMADILMPNLNIESGYEEYLVEGTDGQMITGILAKETPTTITLRRRKGEEDTVLRSSIKSMRSLSVSPMPEDLDKNVSIEQMADLIAYIKSLR